MNAEHVNADECTVLDVTCASHESTGPVTHVIVTLLTDDGDTLSLAFSKDETHRLVTSILERVGGPDDDSNS